MYTYITGTANHHGVTYTHIFAPGFVLVVQRGVGNGHAAHKHGRELGHGRELASAPHLHLNGLHGGELFLRRVFVGHGPARFAGDEAQALLQVAAVDLVDHAVDVEGQVGALAFDAVIRGGFVALEPVYAILFAALLFSDVVSPVVALSGALIVGASFLLLSRATTPSQAMP